MSANRGRPIRLDCDVKRASPPNSSSLGTRRPGSSSVLHSSTVPVSSTVTTPISAIRWRAWPSPVVSISTNASRG